MSAVRITVRYLDQESGEVGVFVDGKLAYKSYHPAFDEQRHILALLRAMTVENVVVGDGEQEEAV